MATRFPGVHPAAEIEAEKRLAAEAAAELVEDGMTVGLGTGSTVAYLLPALAARKLELRCVATSPRPRPRRAISGFPVEPFERLERLDIAIDGADQVAPDGWLVKGGGGAHTREKIVAAAAERFVVIADSSKPVDAIAAPIPLELHPFGLRASLFELGDVRLRDWPPSPDGGVIADYDGRGRRPRGARGALAATPGVVEHGLFPPALVSDVLIARGDEVERLSFERGQPAAASSASTVASAVASTRPAGIDWSPASSFASASRLSAPVMSQKTLRASASAG